MSPTRLCTALLSTTLLAVALGGCAGTPPAPDDAVARATDLATRLATGGRSDGEKARDAGRRPAAVLTFLGIGEGMHVLDVLASGGYYSEVLAEAVGPEGLVYAQNVEFVLKMRDGVNDAAMTALERAGFVIEATSDVLRNPEDDRTQLVFAPGLRGATDRFVIRARKPQEG